MTPTREELRERAETHQKQLDRDANKWTVQDIADRWGCACSTVRAVPIALLPYINIGQGLVRERRRYDPDDVYAYELHQKTGAAA